MGIGTIVIDGGKRYDKIFDARFDYVDEIIHDAKTPMIIVGYHKVKSIYESINILDRKISDNIYWTFTENEDNYLCKSDLYDFRSLCYNRAISNMKYIFVDPYILGEDKYSNFFKYIGNNKHSLYRYGEVLYFVVDKTVYGVNEMFDRVSYGQLKNIIESEVNIVEDKIYMGDDSLLSPRNAVWIKHITTDV